MKKWYHSSLAWFAITFLLALCIVLFVGREFNPLTKQETITISSHGRQQFRKGMDVAWGVKLTYKIDFSKYDQLYKDQSERDVAKKRAIGIILKNIDKRISSLWVSDYTARQQIIDADNFIVIEIGGIYSLDAAKDLIGKTVELEFKVPAELSPEKDTLVAERAILAKSLFASIKKTPEKLNELVVGQESNDVYAQLLSGIDYDKLPLMYQNNRQKIIAAKAWDIIDLWLWDYAETQFASWENTTIRWYTLLLIDKVEKWISQTSTWAIIVTWSQKETYFLTAKEIFISEKPQWIVAIDPSTKEILNGAFFSYASTSMSQTGKPVVSINFDDKGKEIFCNLTKTYVNKQMAIFVWGQLMTAPTINEPICGGSAQIDGQFTSKTAKELAAWLNEWALPAPLILSQEEKVSALLGDSAMEWAIKAALIALVAIFIFLLFLFERKLAVLGLVVLISYVIYLLAVFKIIDYAFSLSGIAAIVLSLGMGIDANILIFERLREELKSGKSWKSAAETAYERSWFAILDGNMTTILIFLVLFFMGMSIFKWFGLAGIVTGWLILLVAAPLTKQLLLRIKK
jgi:protein-export membrane protein SecD